MTNDTERSGPMVLQSAATEASSLLGHRLRAVVRFTVFLLALAVTNQALAQPTWDSTTIYTVPSQPYSANPFQVVVMGGAKVGCAPLIVDGTASSINASTIQVTSMITCGAAPLLEGRYSVVTTVGPISAGAYTIQHLRQIRFDPVMPYSAPQLAGTLALVVANGVAPSIPALGDVALAVLAVLTLAIGVWRLRSRSFDTRAVSMIALCGALAPLAYAAWPIRADAAASAEIIAARQLVVLFDPRVTALTSSQLVAAISGPVRDASVDAMLLHPVSATRLMPDVASDELRSQLAQSPLSPRALLEEYVVLTYADQATARAAMAQLSMNHSVLSVEPDRPVGYSATPNDCYFGDPHAPPCQAIPSAPGNYQWGMQLLRFPPAWEKVRGHNYLAAIDSGIDEMHPDLRKNFRALFSRNLIAGQPASDIDDNFFGDGAYRGHGTHVSGIMGATPEFGQFTSIAPGQNANSGVAGGCWGCSLGMFKFDQFFSNAAAALTAAVDRGFAAVNISFGDGAYGDQQYISCSQATFQAFCTAIAYAASRDVALVAASGNQAAARIQFPARDPNVIAVGGVEVDSTFWTAHPNYLDPGSNYGAQQAVVAPARDILSTFYRGYDWNLAVPCGDAIGPDPPTSIGYGDCTGTSMSAPYVTALAGLIRSANPLLSRSMTKGMITATARPCAGGDSRCGSGIPDAGMAVAAALGDPAVVNRVTPLFAHWSATAKDHFYTSVPQMALASLTSGGLMPQPTSGAISYAQIGVAVPGYPTFPSDFSPGPSAAAIASVFTTHRSPLLRGLELAPMYRLSRRCGDEPAGTIPACTSGDPHYNPYHVTHFYTSDPEGVKQMTGYDINGLKLAGYPAGWGYRMDGIEGYVIPVTQAQRPGTVKLCRKYDVDRDDWILFPGAGPTGTDCSATTDGYTGGNYSGSITGYDWIGWAYPVRAPQPVYATAYLPALSLLLDD